MYISEKYLKLGASGAFVACSSMYFTSAPREFWKGIAIGVSAKILHKGMVYLIEQAETRNITSETAEEAEQRKNTSWNKTLLMKTVGKLSGGICVKSCLDAFNHHHTPALLLNEFGIKYFAFIFVPLVVNSSVDVLFNKKEYPSGRDIALELSTEFFDEALGYYITSKIAGNALTAQSVLLKTLIKTVANTVKGYVFKGESFSEPSMYTRSFHNACSVVGSQTAAALAVKMVSGRGLPPLVIFGVWYATFISLRMGTAPSKPQALANDVVIAR